jgi:hypothetical protein
MVNLLHYGLSDYPAPAFAGGRLGPEQPGLGEVSSNRPNKIIIARTT